MQNSLLFSSHHPNIFQMTLICKQKWGDSSLDKMCRIRNYRKILFR